MGAVCLFVCLEELFLHVTGNFAVAGGVGHARQDKAIVDLLVLQEGLFGLIDGSRDHLSGAAGAGSGTARVGKIDSGIFGGIDNEHVIGAIDGRIEVVFFRDQLDLVAQGTTGSSGAGEGSGGESLGGGNGSNEGEESLGEHDRYLDVVIVIVLVDKLK